MSRKALIVLVLLLIASTCLACSEGALNNTSSDAVQSLEGSSVASQPEESVPSVISLPESWEPESSAADSSSEASEDSSEPVSEPVSELVSEPEENSIDSDISESSVSVVAPDSPHMVNGFLVNGNRGMELFGGTAESGAETAKLLNQFKQRVGDGVQVYAMPIPLACAFYAPEGYERSINRTKECFYGLRDALQDVHFVDAYVALLPHTEEEIYARTDHHWFALGASYAAQALCASAGVSFAPLSSFEQKSFDGFLGSVYSSYKVDELIKHPETFVWYEPTQAYTANYYDQKFSFKFSGPVCSTAKSYVKFIYGDDNAVCIDTENKNGRKMLVVKDSFGNALAPFLISGFEQVYFVDIRKFSCNILSFIREHEITDVTFAMSAFTVASSSKRSNITRLMDL